MRINKIFGANLFAVVFLIPAIIVDVVSQVITLIVTPIRVFMELRLWFIKNSK